MLLSHLSIVSRREHYVPTPLHLLLRTHRSLLRRWTEGANSPTSKSRRDHPVGVTRKPAERPVPTRRSPHSPRPGPATAAALPAVTHDLGHHEEPGQGPQELPVVGEGAGAGRQVGGEGAAGGGHRVGARARRLLLRLRHRRLHRWRRGAAPSPAAGQGLRPPERRRERRRRAALCGPLASARGGGCSAPGPEQRGGSAQEAAQPARSCPRGGSGAAACRGGL